MPSPPASPRRGLWISLAAAIRQGQEARGRRKISGECGGHGGLELGGVPLGSGDAGLRRAPRGALGVLRRLLDQCVQISSATSAGRTGAATHAFEDGIDPVGCLTRRRVVVDVCGDLFGCARSRSDEVTPERHRGPILQARQRHVAHRHAGDPQAVEDARAEGRRVGLLRTSTVWPFPDKAVASVAERVRCIVVAEMNLGQLVHEVKRAAEGRCKVVSVNRIDGLMLESSQIAARLKEVL